MDDLSKTQVILLTLFITFVTSIATGVVTVTLLDQSPPGVTQTINRVVEKTIEKVISPAETKEVRVIVSESQMMSEAVRKAKSAIVRIIPAETELSNLPKNSNNENAGVVALEIPLDNQELPSLVGQNLIDLPKSQVGAPYLVAKALALIGSVSPNDHRMGIILNDGLVVTVNEVLAEKSYLILTEDKTEIKAEVVSFPNEHGLYFLKPKKEDVSKVKVSNTGRLATERPSLGQTVAAVSFDGDNYTADIGIVSRIPEGTEPILVVDTNINLQSYNIGGPVINTEGKIVGIVFTKSKIISASVLNDLVQSISGAKTPKPIN